MHSNTNYPAKKSTSYLEVELEDNLEDQNYIKILKRNITELNKENFDYIYNIAGVDNNFNYRLVKLKISDEGVIWRDEIVIENLSYKRITTHCV